MRAGELDRVLTIERRDDAKGASGGANPNWTTFKSDIRAKRIPLLGRKYFAAQQVNAEISASFRIRYLPGLEETMRIREQSTGRLFDIVSIQEIGRQDGFEIMAKVHRET